MQHGTDIPTVPQSLFVGGEEITEGTFVLLTCDEPDDEAGEVWGVDAFKGRVYVSWPVKVAGGYKYDQSWHPISEIVFVR
jgi:hypothetical protein